jgi:glycosyltransferase involved in cell wall biosynthesis
MKKGVPDPRSIGRLATIIRDYRPDIVHSHMPHANLLVRATRLLVPFPVHIGTLHALNMAGVEHDRGGYYELGHRTTDVLSECTTAICHAAADYYVKSKSVPIDKMLVVHNGIDTTHFARRSEETRLRLRRELGIDGQFVWIAAGRLELAKAYPTLLRAFARVGDDSTLLICGRGSLERQLKALCSELALGSRVRFLGLRSDVPDLLSAADAFVLSSDSEGLPLVLLQASAAGLPTIATSVGGNAEAVEDGVNGFLVRPGKPSELADAMTRIMALSTDQRDALGRAGLRRVREMFETDQVVKRWERLYSGLFNAVGGVAGRHVHGDKRDAVCDVLRQSRRAFSALSRRRHVEESDRSELRVRGKDHATNSVATFAVSGDARA